MKIAIYGGKFDPPHMAHQYTIFALFSKFKVDAVHIVPSFSNHPFNLPTSDFRHRIAMCEMMMQPFTNKGLSSDRVLLSKIEEEMAKPVYAVDLVKEFKKLYSARPETKFAIAIGSDNWERRDEWKNFDLLEKEADVIVFGRGSVLNKFVPLPGVSSSRIRKMVKNGMEIDHLVPNGIAEYIKANKLYLEK